MADSGQRTEKPTQRRLQKAREQGQFPTSKEFVGAIQFVVFVWLAISYAPEWFAKACAMMRHLLAAGFGRDLSQQEIIRFVYELVLPNVPLLLTMAGGLLVSTTGIHLMTTELGFATQNLRPNFGRLNPAKKIPQMFRQNIPAVFQAAVLLPLFLWTAYYLVLDRAGDFATLPLGSVESGVQRIAIALRDLLWKAAGAFIIFGVIDLFRQRRKHNADLRMTKHQIKEEVKESEGDPHIKARIRRIQRDLMRRNMMKEVPNATAVVVNPTHYAVAIKYSVDAMAAPLVVAKGKNYLALRIRAIAEENKVPIVENVPLAQALYKSVEIGQEIPPHLYRAVAEVLAYIFRLMHDKKGR